MNSNRLALMAICPDRTGLVARLSEYLLSRGANIQDSRMAVLGEEFGIMVLCSGSEEQLAAIERELPGFEREVGFRVLAKRTRSSSRETSTVPCLVRVEAIDHEGIVHAVSQEIHRLGANIDSLETSVYQAPVSGSPLFRLEARLSLPPGKKPEAIREALAAVAERENLEIRVEGLAS